METSQYRTPYEKYVRENIDAEKRKLDSLYDEFARSNSLTKQVLKRRIDETLQNIELLQKDLEKYGAGLSWLREPSKDRDVKAEHLEKIQEEKPAPPPATKPASGAPRPTVGAPVGKPSVGTPVGAKPTVGTPVGKPQIGTPAGARPQIGSPVGAKPQVGTPVGTRPQVGAPVAAKPQVGTPVGSRPQIGTPVGAKPQVGTPKDNPTEVKPTEAKPAETPSAGTEAAKPGVVPIASRPRIGTPKPSQEKKETT